MENNDSFNYTYSAAEQKEIKNIRDKYLQKEPDKMEQLRKLDKSVTQKASVTALVVGIIGALLLGLGMSCAMVWMGVWFIPGIIIGVAGIAFISVAFPLYNRVIKKEREKIAPDIIRLTDELIK